MGGVFNIVKKEVKEMVRDPRMLLGMIIVPLLIFPIMGSAMSASISSIEESTSHIDIAMINRDVGNRSLEFLAIMEYRNVTIHDYQTSTLDEVIAIEDPEFDLIVVIPPDFTSAIEGYSSIIIDIYTIMRTYSISEALPSDVMAGYIREYRQMILDERISEAFPGQNVIDIEYPVLTASHSVIDGRIEDVPPTQISEQMMTQSIMMPMVMMILLIMAAQLAATSVAMEKEEKTLETLLTMPVSRNSILLGKIGGVVAISAIAVVAYMFGFSYYMSSVTAMSEGTGVNLAEIGLVPTMAGTALLLATLFLSLISALSVAVLTASFTEDVRSAQALMGILYVPIFIPSIILMFGDLSQLPSAIQGMILAIPFSYPILASKAMYTETYTIIIFGIVYQIVFTAVTIFLAGRLFSSEKILTAKINLKNKKGLGFPILDAISGMKKKK